MDVIVKCFRDLIGTHKTAEIVNLYGGNVVRRLALMSATDSVMVDFGDQRTIFPLDLEIKYEPWCMDRGSLLFIAEKIGFGKLCTEFDLIRYDDGTEFRICHPDGIA